MKRVLLLTVLFTSLVLSGCSNSANLALEDSVEDVSQDTSVNLSENPSYCEQDTDCMAIPNPANGCYYGYFNVRVPQGAIDEWKDSIGMMIQDCPQFGEVYCRKHICTADLLK